MGAHQDRVDLVIKRLKKKGCRITPQRLAIIRILAESNVHPTVEEIYERVRVNFPTTSLATVYKTVSVMKELGEVLELEFSSDQNRYDGHNPSPHPHCICVKCRSIVDPELGSLAHITRELASGTGYRILSHRLDFYGICPKCQGES